MYNKNLLMNKLGLSNRIQQRIIQPFRMFIKGGKIRQTNVVLCISIAYTIVCE